MSKSLRIATLMAVVIVAGLVLLVRLQVASSNSGEVCDRTSQVGNAIAAASGVESCSDVSTIHLSDVTSLDLSERDLSGLDADDFAGLVRLETLDLSHNSLTALPEDVFDDLYLLRTLHLNNNLLTTLPEDVFDQLFLLDDLTLHGNPSLELPDGMFDDFSPFDGIQPNGDVTADTGDSYPHINSYLRAHDITSPEEFIAALPPLHKERFSVVLQSEAAARDHVSGDHPRIISFGADGRFTFAWNTDPDAPSMFRDSVEFLRQNDDDWSAGIIDFSGDSPSITEPASCMACHGTLNKPLWGKWYEWEGTEYDNDGGKEADAVNAYMRGLYESDDLRIEPLDFSASAIFSGNYAERFLKSPGLEPDVLAVEEAGSIWSWRHGEVLLHRLKARHRDFRQYAEDLTCASAAVAQQDVLNREFDEREHHLLVSADLTDAEIEELLTNMLRYSYNYATAAYGSMSGVINFLLLVELWEEEPIVRKLYRETSNEETVTPAQAWAMDPYLYYKAGTATAEDELIQKIRLHFGQGSRTTLNARAKQNQTILYRAVHSSFFWPAHVEVMRSRACEAITDGRPENLQTSEAGDDIVISWDAPGYQPDSVTGYRLLRSVNGAALEVHVADTGTADTTWTDENPPAGDRVYVVQAIYDDYYLGPASVRPNIRATGAPDIVGTAQVGETLTADTSDIGDGDGLTVVSYSYQWISNDGTSDSDIENATSSTHTLAVAEGGKTIRVRVSFTDDGGHDETLTSDATDPVALLPNTPATGSPTITGTVQVGETLTADTSGVADADGLTAVSYSYQWISNDGTSDSDIANATSSTHTLVTAEEGKTIMVKVSFTDDAGHDETLTSDATGTVGIRANQPATGSPTISGTLEAGETLTADTSGIGDADGLDNVTFGYQWIADDTDITGETGTTYALTASDQGKPMKVRVSFTDDAGNAESLTSGAADVPIRPWGLTATVSNGVVVLTWNAPVNYPSLLDYRILRNRPEMGESEPLVHSDTRNLQTTYTDTAAEAGVLYVYRVQAGSFFRLSEKSEPVEVRIPESVPTANSPATGDPIISGTAQVGETLTADTSGIADADGLDNVSFSYQWVVNDGTSDSDIEDASGTTYTLTTDDDGRTVRVRVIFTDDAGNEESLTSAATATVGTALSASIVDAPESHDGENDFTFELRFSETPVSDFSYRTLRDHALTVAGGTVAAAERLDPPGNVRWEITVGPSSDADVTIVLPVTTDCDDQRAICTEDGRMLSDEVTLTVAGPQEEEVQAPPQNHPATGTPTIGGTAQVGQTLTAITTGITDADGLNNVLYSFQWIRTDGTDDTEIPGASDSAYTLVDADNGKAIKVQISFTDDEGNPESLTSVATASVTAAPELSLSDLNVGDDQNVLASALIRVGDRGRKNENQERAWYALDTSAWHASGELRAGSLSWNEMTLNRVLYLSDTERFRLNDGDAIHIGDSFADGGVNRELTIWIRTEDSQVSFRAEDHILNSGSNYINFTPPLAIRSTLDSVATDDLIIVAVSEPEGS